MELLLQREPSERSTTFGDLSIDGVHECLTLEDEVREPAGWRDGITEWDADGLQRAVLKWKVPKRTAVPSGRYRLTFENSKRFGPGTLTVNGVHGFSSIRMHGGTDAEDTEGCVIVGDKQDRFNMAISGAKFDHVLDRLKAKVRKALDEGQEAWITIRNSEGVAV